MSALRQEVALAVEMCEPLTLGAEPAFLLTLRGAVGEPVVADNVVLGQVTGPLLPLYQSNCGETIRIRSIDHTTKSEQV